MLAELRDVIEKKKLFSKGDRLLLACSGGCDSTALAYALHELGYTFDIAHVNFKLRGKDSDLDQRFCEALARKFNSELHGAELPAKEFAKKNKVSIQMAARELRYTWFQQLLSEKDYVRLITAHHLNDDVETFFINLLRGGGIAGLKGMEYRRGNHVRPLLTISRKQIEQYCRKKKIRYRTDKSNQEEHYERNLIRKKLIPVLMKIEPSFEKLMARDLTILKEEYQLLRSIWRKESEDMISSDGKDTLIDKRSFRGPDTNRTLLHFILKEYGFNASQCNSAIEACGTKAGVGKKFISPSHQLLVEKEVLRLIPHVAANKDIRFKDLEQISSSGIFEAKKMNKFERPTPDQLWVSLSSLQFPLSYRKVRAGDRFVPFGMKGSKLLSDFFKDSRVNQVERRRMRVLENGNGELIWLPGLRSDERYKVNGTEKDLIRISYHGE